jgi:hypothetical protein
VTVVDLLTGWLGVAVIAGAVALALALEVVDERSTAGTGTASSRGRVARRALTGVLILLVLASLAATVVRLVVLGD